MPIFSRGSAGAERLVVALIELPELAGLEGPPPFLVLDKPCHGPFHAGFEADRRAPAEAREARRVERVAAVVAEAIAHELLERGGLAKQPQHGVGDGDAIGLPARADVVVHARNTATERAVDAAGMVLDVQVIANRPAVAVDRQRTIVDRVGDEQRDDLLRVLIRTVRVRAAGHDRRESVRRAVRLDLQLTPRLARAVRAAG